MLIGEGEYNINVMTETKVTESFLGLDQDVRECQNDETLYDCTTRNHVNSMLEQCGCLPINMIGLLSKVHKKPLSLTRKHTLFLFCRILYALL